MSRAYPPMHTIVEKSCELLIAKVDVDGPRLLETLRCHGIGINTMFEDESGQFSMDYSNEEAHEALRPRS